MMSPEFFTNAMLPLPSLPKKLGDITRRLSRNLEVVNNSGAIIIRSNDDKKDWVVAMALRETLKYSGFPWLSVSS